MAIQFSTFAEQLEKFAANPERKAMLQSVREDPSNWNMVSDWLQEHERVSSVRANEILNGVAGRIESIIWHDQYDEDVDLSFLGEYTSRYEEGAIDRQERGDMGRGEHRYFVPANSGEDGERDYEQAERYNRDGVDAHRYILAANVFADNREQMIESMGIGGVIEPNDEYEQELYQEELKSLTQTLLSMGFTKRQINAAIQASQS